MQHANWEQLVADAREQGASTPAQLVEQITVEGLIDQLPRTLIAAVMRDILRAARRGQEYTAKRLLAIACPGAAAADPQPTQFVDATCKEIDDIPNCVGNYAIVRRLAMGGMAEVFLAERCGDGGFRKQLAIKRVRRRYANDSQFVEMFRNEARVHAAVVHPNIPQMFDFQYSDGAMYLVMEYVAGTTVKKLLSIAASTCTTVPLDVAVSIATEIATALSYVHRRTDSSGTPLGIVHCDVSPSNVIVGDEGRVKLIDFGVARIGLPNVGKSERFVRGKPGYMSPEQCMCYPIDCRSDVFALGLMLYELTTGRPALVGTVYQVMLQTTRGRIRRPSLLCPQYPEALEAVVMKSLQLRPELRYQSMAELLEDLTRVASQLKLEISAQRRDVFVEQLLRAHEGQRRAEAGKQRIRPTPLLETGGSAPQSMSVGTSQLNASDVESAMLSAVSAAPVQEPSIEVQDQ